MKPQSRHNAKLFLQSLELGLPPHLPHPQASAPPPPLVPGRGGGAHSLAGEGVGGPNADAGTYTVVL
jgi:hypothetical protein